MTEDAVGKGLIQIKEVTVAPDGLYSIPSDDGAEVELDIFQISNGDLAIWPHDKTGKIYVTPVRINSGPGGGEQYCFFHDELVMNLIQKFKETKGQLPKSYYNETRKFDKYHRDFAGWVFTGKEEDSFRLKIQGIESVENEPDRESLFDSFMDIEIAKNGNVTVTIINPFEREETKARQLSFLFKTAENGGKFPLVAAAFTRATERAVAAKRNKIDTRSSASWKK